MEDLRRPSHRSSSDTIFVPIDPFKPSVAYRLKNIVTRRRATTMDESHQVSRQSTFLSPDPSDGYILPLGHNEHNIRPPHEIASRANSEPPLTDLPHPNAITHPLYTTNYRTSSPTPFRSSPISIVEGPLSVIREDATDVDALGDDYRGPDIMPQYSASKNPRVHKRHNLSHAASYSTQARESVSQMVTEAPRYATTRSEKITQHALRKAEKEHTVAGDGSPFHLFQKGETNVLNYLYAFVVDTLPRQIYLHLHLRLPYLYYSRVIRIFEDARMTLLEIEGATLEIPTESKDPTNLHNLEALIMNSSPQYANLRRSWTLFIDCLLREWKTLNIISVLLLSAILTILQIQSAADDPVTRYTALLSMICALMSLLYGCAFIIRFGTMRTTYKAAEWAREAQESTTSIFWNVWVLLAMPTIWLAWSIIMFCASIMSFVWRTGTTDDVNRGPVTAHDARTPRIIITVVFVLGVIYFMLIVSTLRRYGETMDRAWQDRIRLWVRNKVVQVEDTLRRHSRPGSRSPSQTRSPRDVRNSRVASPRHSKDSIESEKSSTSLGIEISVLPPSRPSSPSPSLASLQQQYSFIQGPDLPPKPVQHDSALSNLHQILHIISSDDETSSTTSTDRVAGEDWHTKQKSLQATQQINVTKLFSVSPDSTSATLPVAEEILSSCILGKEDYEKLTLDVYSEANWDTTNTLNVDGVKDVLQRWNNTFFFQRGGQIQLCEELLMLDDLSDIKDNTGTDTGGGHMIPPRPSTGHAVFHFLWKLPHGPDRSNSKPEGL